MQMRSSHKKVFRALIIIPSMTAVFALLSVLQKYLFAENSLKEKVFSRSAHSPNYVSGVVPHHLLAKSIIEKFFIELSKENYPQEIVLLSPDHFNTSAVYGNKPITVNILTTDLENLAIDSALVKTLSEISDLAFSDYAIKNDHGIMNILPFIKRYFPETKIVPFLIPANFPLDKAKNVVEDLNKILPDNSFVLSSVDWSHYLPKNVADFHDVKSIRVLLNFEEENFSNIDVDCPQCLYISRYFAKLRNAENYKKISHKNSQDFAKGKILNNTTSYFSVLFSKGKTASEIAKSKRPKTVLFLGDIMLDRGVKRLMDKNGSLYPIKKIKNFLKGIDIVVGNLEGPIVLNPTYTPPRSMKFNFGPEALNLLHHAKINAVSLANNHTLDRGKDGLLQTKELLRSKNIKYFGDPISCSEESIYKTDDIVFIGLNETLPFNCSRKQIKALIENVRSENPSSFIIVFVHWGEEYKPRSNANQKQLAHLMIDSGADLIIGSHPHVVQEIEKYKGKLIFYSLGNFIFDQYFSKQTQEGLAVGLELREKGALIRLFPFGISKSQPYLFNNADRVKFLEYLSSKSPTIPKSQILSGIITIDISPRQNQKIWRSGLLHLSVALARK